MSARYMHIRGLQSAGDVSLAHRGELGAVACPMAARTLETDYLVVAARPVWRLWTRSSPRRMRRSH